MRAVSPVRAHLRASRMISRSFVGWAKAVDAAKPQTVAVPTLFGRPVGMPYCSRDGCNTTLPTLQLATLVLAFSVIAMAGASPAFAQAQFSGKPVKFIIPFPGGG